MVAFQGKERLRDMKKREYPVTKEQHVQRPKEKIILCNRKGISIVKIRHKLTG